MNARRGERNPGDLGTTTLARALAGRQEHEAVPAARCAQQTKRGTYLVPVSVHCSWLVILQGVIARGESVAPMAARRGRSDSGGASRAIQIGSGSSVRALWSEVVADARRD